MFAKGKLKILTQLFKFMSFNYADVTDCMQTACIWWSQQRSSLTTLRIAP